MSSVAPKVLFLHNEHLATEALLGDAFTESGFDVDTFEVVPPERIDSPAGEVTFPDPAGYDVIVPLGARWPVYDDALQRTWVEDALGVVRDAADAGVPFGRAGGHVGQGFRERYGQFARRVHVAEEGGGDGIPVLLAGVPRL